MNLPLIAKSWKLSNWNSKEDKLFANHKMHPCLGSRLQNRSHAVSDVTDVGWG